ncbi:MAG: radical SAM protein [Elusimicrobia bacterium]|nr:radical SAM protein [Elusimicrobiota bacterium]
MSFDLKKCNICPIECGADRTRTRGFCGAGRSLEISSWNLHFGEEPPISGHRGSGTVFFTHCSLKCKFCQNYPISHLGNGKKYSKEDFMEIMLGLQRDGAHNINLVTPTHYAPQIIEALSMIKGGRLKIPVVYNSSGYEKVETLEALEGLVDIYMPDAKYSDSRKASGLCEAKDYWKVNKKAIKEMHRQVGGLMINRNGIAERGLLIRHLVLPGDLSGTGAVLKFIAEEIGPDTYLSLMSQYHPAHKAVKHETLGRKITKKEYEKAVDAAIGLGMSNGYFQIF